MQLDLRFALTWEDLRGAAHYLRPPLKSFRWLVRQAVAFGLSFGILALFIVGMQRHWPEKYMFAPALLMALGMLLGILNGMRWSMVRSGWIYGSPWMTVKISDDTFRISIRRKTGEIQWKQFEAVFQNETGIYLRNYGGGGYCLPTRVFPPTVNSLELYEWIKSQLIASPLNLVTTDIQLNVSKAEKIYDPAEIARLETRGMVAVAVGIIGGILVVCIFASSRKTNVNAYVIPTVIAAHLLQIWGCTNLTRARGFRFIHGLIGIIPFLGLLFIATRAKPEPGEQIDRDSWQGFLTAPFARQSDISSWYRED